LDIAVISPENSYPNEHDWMVQLFEAGLSRYHVRKPGMTESEVEKYLMKVPQVWRSKLVLHQGHSLVDLLYLGGWHVKDDAAQLAKAGHLLDSREPGKTLSRSIHSLADLNENLLNWDYVFLSPVFQSISKRNYGSKWEATELTSAVRNFKEAYPTRVFALGGVDDSRVQACGQMGFDGVALLGAIWQSRYPLESYLRARETLNLSIH
jgi:thiamine-phosphate pyrophosphorylase